MSEIRNLTRNGETFYPLTHEKAVIGMEDFKDTITEQIDNYRPIDITGNVTNAPDEEDITSDSNNLLKFKNRNNLYGLGKVILRRGSSFASQVTQSNTIYIIQYNFDLENGRVNVPNGSILLFEGGTLSNGTLVCADLYDVRLVYYQDISVILNSVILEGNFIHKACDKDTVREILVDNSSITKDVNDVLSVKANGIQNSHLNSNTVDNSSVGLDSNNKISIKTSGVQGINLNSNVVNTDDLAYDDGNHNLKFANRSYNSLSPNGMGYKILRKDTTFESQVTETNTIYEIRYDFTLSGSETKTLTFSSSNVSTVVTPEKSSLDYRQSLYDQSQTAVNASDLQVARNDYEAIGSQDYFYWVEVQMEAGHALHLSGRAIQLNSNKNAKVAIDNNTIYADSNTTVIVGCLAGEFSFRYDKIFTIPENCVLKFNGGSVTNGTLKGQNTAIQAESTRIFSNKTSLIGTWSTTDAFIEWFGVSANGTSDDFNSIQEALYFKGNVHFGNNKIYGISSGLTSEPTCRIKGHGSEIKLLNDVNTILTSAYVEDLIVNGNSNRVKYGILINNTAQDSIISGCHVKSIHNTNGEACGIIVNDINSYYGDCEVSNNIVEDIYSPDDNIIGDLLGSATGISSYGRSKLKILNNSIHNIRVNDDGYGIYVGIMSGSEVAPIVKGNLIFDVYNTGIKSHHNGIIIDGNIITQTRLTSTTSNMSYGVRLYTQNARVTNNVLNFNEQSPQYGIFLDSPSSNNYVGFNKFNSPHACFQIQSKTENNIIEGHKITSDFPYTSEHYNWVCIDILGGTCNTLIGNSITSLIGAISLSGGGHCLINNYISSPKILLGWTSFTITIEHNVMPNTVIKTGTQVDGLNIAGNYLAGFTGAKLTSYVYRNIVIRDNIFTENNGLSTEGYGTIDFWYGGDILIEGNTFNNSSDTYPEINIARLTNTKIIGNTFKTSTKPFSVVGDANLIVTSNIAPSGSTVNISGAGLLTSYVVDNNLNISFPQS